MFAFGNCYSSRIQKSFQILNAHGHNVIPFDSLTSNSIHFRIANISTSVKISRLPVLLENVCPKVSCSQSASYILVKQIFARKGGLTLHNS